VQQDNDKEGRKPYRTYKAGRARRSSVDEELAGARPPRQRPPTEDERRDPDPRPRSAENDGAGYRRYGTPATPANKGRKKAKGAGVVPKRRRRFRWWFVPVGLLLVVIIGGVVVTVLAWPGYKKFDRAVTKANHRVDRKTRAELAPDDGWIWRNGTTLLLFGIDSKAGEPARSDTIMLMRFNPKTHTINQLSIPRDTRVELPGRGYDKINTAMFWGGPSLAVKTVKRFLGVKVNHVMVVSFQGFPRLVNAVGGVDLNVPKTVTTVAGKYGRTVVFKKGMHHFDGKNAMLYVRIRYVDDDFHRAARQQQFVQALQSTIAKPSNVTKLPEIGKRFMSGVATDLTTNQILELAYLKWRAKGGKKLVMVGTPGYDGGVAYVYPPSSAQKQKMIHQFLTN
jgi:polyisoprenyl-teichoic acid--peptidoglycan teichoic acid transferase